MSRPERRATYQDLMQVPDNQIAQIIDGELIATPRPALPHAAVVTALAGDLDRVNGRPGGLGGRQGGWWILFEPELHLGEDVIVPDLAGWAQERMPRIPKVAALTLPPDWLCEVISPTTGRIDRGPKMTIYAREGVRHLWLVDPIAQTLEVYHLEADRWIIASTHGGSDVVSPDPFAPIAFDLGRWWGEIGSDQSAPG